MKTILSKLLFVLAIVGIIAAGNLMFPNAENDTLNTNTNVKPLAESARANPESEEYAEPDLEPEENLE